MIGARIALPRPGRARSGPRASTLRRIPRPRARVVVAAAAALVGLGAAGLWLRDSSLVAVEQVHVGGAGGPDGPAIRSALTTAAKGMTTLHVREQVLHDAVTSYPVVKDLRVSAHPLHGLSIGVVEYVPAAVVEDGARRLAVAADGTILRKAPLDNLPLVPARALPSGDRLLDRQALGAVALAGAAPASLRPLITRIRSGGHDGLRADLRGGLRIVFGSRERLAAKWSAAARVLADPKGAGAAYVDVRLPDRPVAGPFADPAPASAAQSQTAPAGPDVASQGQSAPATSSAGADASQGADGAGPGAGSAGSPAPSLDAQPNP